MMEIRTERCQPRLKRVFEPHGQPMAIVFFASGGPGNLNAICELQQAAPGVLEIGLVVTDRPAIPAVSIARERGIPCLVHDFEAECGRWSECCRDSASREAYRKRAEAFHTAVLWRICEHEQRARRRFDLAVLAYRRLIQGPLLRYFTDRMINQHPADLSIRGAGGSGRLYTGLGGHARALANSEGAPAPRQSW